MQKLLMILFVMCACGVLSAQEATPPPNLPLNTPVEGQIDFAGASETWTFYAVREAAYSLRVEADASELDPVVEVRGSAGTLISNDDYAYPQSADALLEAITIPQTGIYEVVVSGFGESTGAYRLTLLPGYAQIALDERFATLQDWQTENVGTVDVADGVATISLEGIQQRGVLIHEMPALRDTFYARVEIAGITYTNGWTAGIVLARQPNGDSYLAMVNASGGWRFAAVENGTERAIRDWAPHPAILAGETSFSLGVMAYGGGFDVFYNDQFIGKVIDGGAVLPGSGQIGLLVETSPQASSAAAVRFDSFLVTVPAQVDGAYVLPQQLIVTDAVVITHELERRHLIPGDGVLAWMIDESFVERSTPGVGRLVLVRGSAFQTYAMGTTFTLAAQEAGVTGCGLLLGNTGDTDYTVAYFDNTGAYGVSRRGGETFQQGIYGENPALLAQGAHTLVVIVGADTLRYYVNGYYAGEMAYDPPSGEVGNIVINFDPVRASCQFRNTWLWR